MSIKSLKSMKNRTNSKKKEETAQQGLDNKGADLSTDSPATKPPDSMANSGVKFMEKEPLENCVRRVVANLQEPINNSFFSSYIF
jgi:hypothetical protein